MWNTVHALIIMYYNYLGLIVPTPVKKREHPKGHELTTIGLPAKKARKEKKKKKPCSFSKLPTSEKEKGCNNYCYVGKKALPLFLFPSYSYSIMVCGQASCDRAIKQHQLIECGM